MTAGPTSGGGPAGLPDALVSGQWLAEHHEQVRIVDMRWYLDGRSGRDAYAAGHLPGAVRLDIDTELSDPVAPGSGRHPLPSPERFAAALGRAGIAAGAPVVAYDDAGGSVAARLWWLLHVLGEPVAVLDGGLAAWPRPLTTELPDIAPVDASAATLADRSGSSPPTRSGRRRPRPRPSFRQRCSTRAAAARYAHGDPAHRPASRPHPGRPVGPVGRQPRRDRPVPDARPAARALRRAR